MYRLPCTYFLTSHSRNICHLENKKALKRPFDLESESMPVDHNFFSCFLVIGSVGFDRAGVLEQLKMIITIEEFIFFHETI